MAYTVGAPGATVFAAGTGVGALGVPVVRGNGHCGATRAAGFLQPASAACVRPAPAASLEQACTQGAVSFWRV